MLRIILITILSFTAACAEQILGDCTEIHEPKLIERAWQGIRPYLEEFEKVEFEEGRRRHEANSQSHLYDCGNAYLFVSVPREGVAGSIGKYVLDRETFELRKFALFDIWLDWPFDPMQLQRIIDQRCPIKGLIDDRRDGTAGCDI